MNPGDPGDDAAKKAADAAGAAVPGDAGAEISADLHAQMMKLKRAIAGDPALQQKLIDGIQSLPEFHERLVALGAEHGVDVTPAQTHAFLMQRAQMLGDETPDPGPPSSTGHTCESTCTMNPYDAPCSYPPPDHTGT